MRQLVKESVDYYIIDEGKFGRALGTAALGATLAFGSPGNVQGQSYPSKMNIMNTDTEAYDDYLSAKKNAKKSGDTTFSYEDWAEDYYSQAQDGENSGIPQIGDNLITIKNVADTTESTFNKVKKILIMEGYKVIESDPEIGYILTDFKAFKGTMMMATPKLSVSIMIEGTSAIIYGTAEVSVNSAIVGTYASKENEIRASLGKSKKTGITIAFRELELIAKKIGSDLEYSKN